MRVRVSLEDRELGPADRGRAIIERLPEGDEDDLDEYGISEGQRILDDLGADDGGDDC